MTPSMALGPQIKFQCPTCRSIIKADSKAAGRKVSCPRCCQRLMIPFAAKNKTILAILPSGEVPLAPIPPPPLPGGDDPFELEAEPDVGDVEEWNPKPFAIAAISLGVFGIMFATASCLSWLFYPAGLACSVLAIVFGTVAKDSRPPWSALASGGRATGWCGIAILVAIILIAILATFFFVGLFQGAFDLRRIR